MDERTRSNKEPRDPGVAGRPAGAGAARPLVALLPLALGSLVLGGCSAQRAPAAATDLVAFDVTQVEPPGPVLPPRPGGVIAVPPGFDVRVRVRPTNPSVRVLHVTTLADVPTCHGRPVPDAYRTKTIVLPTVSPDAMVQDWDLSKFTFSWLNLCPDPAEPAYPTSVPLSGRLTLHAVAEDAGGAVSTGNLTIVVGNGGAGAPAVGMQGVPTRRDRRG